MLGKSMGIRKVLLIVFLLSTFLEVEGAEDCDFVKCVNAVRAYIYDIGSVKRTTFVCKKLSDIPWCLPQCMHNYFPNAFSHKKYNISFTRYCEKNISNRFNANWSCIAQHNYRMLSCLANVNSLTTNDVREDAMFTESCRKYLEMQNCPEQILLTDCGEESAAVVKDLILFILDNYQPFSCKGANVKEVLSMPVYYHLENDYVEAAKYLDSHQFMARNCLTQTLQDEIDLDGYLCGEYDPHANECIHSKNEKSKPDVNKLLLKIISLSGFKCKQSSLELKTISTPHSDESKRIKQNDDYSLDVHPTFDLPKTSTLITIVKGDILHEKTEIPMKDSANDKYVDKNFKPINVSDSTSKNSKSHINQNINSLNVCSRLHLSSHMLIFYFIFLLIIFR